MSKFLGNMYGVQPGDIIPIEVRITDTDQDAVTGLSDLLLKIRRVSDRNLLDFSDNTWDATGTTLTLTEDSDGWYYAVFTVGSVEGFTVPAGNEEYTFEVDGATSQTNGDDVPQYGGITVRTDPAGVDALISANTDIDSCVTGATAAVIARKAVTNRLELADGTTGNLVLYDDDGTTPLYTFAVTDYRGEAVDQARGAPAKRGAGS